MLEVGLSSLSVQPLLMGPERTPSEIEKIFRQQRSFRAGALLCSFSVLSMFVSLIWEGSPPNFGGGLPPYLVVPKRAALPILGGVFCRFPDCIFSRASRFNVN